MSEEQKNIEEQIKCLLTQGKSQRTIARDLNVGRRLVSRIKKETKSGAKISLTISSKLNPFKAEIKQWAEREQLTAQEIHSRICDRGMIVSYETVTRYIKKISKEEVYIPLVTGPGEEAQVDFGYFGEFEKSGAHVKVWVFCLVLSYSRYAFYKVVTDQTIATFLHCHKEAFQFFKGTPFTIKLDNLKAGVLQANLFEPVIQPQYNNFLGYYGAQPIACRPGRGQDKGKVEAGIKYVKTNFLKTVRHRDFYRLVADLQHWNKTVCNQRIHGTTKKVPEKLFLAKEKRKLLPLPKTPYKLTVREERKVSKYGHIFFKENYYSVPHQYTGETVQVQCDGTSLQVSINETLIALHTICQERGNFITNEFHKPPRKQVKTIEDYRQRMEKIGTHAVEVLETLKELRPRHWHPMIRGIEALCKVYKKPDVNRACKMALELKSPNYLTIKQLCVSLPTVTSKPVFITSSEEDHFDLSIYDRLLNQI